MAELCDDCCLADSKGTPCYMMFRKNTDIQICTRYVKDQKKHDKIVASLKKGKEAPKEGDE